MARTRALFQCFSPTRGARSDPRATDTAKTTGSFDVRAPLSPLSPWTQNTQLLERVGKDNKQVGAFRYLLGFLCRVSVFPLPIYSVGDPLGFFPEPGATLCFLRELSSAHSQNNRKSI